MAKSEKILPTPYFPLQAAVFEGALAITAIAVGWAFGQAPSDTIKLNAAAIGLGIAAVLPLMGLLLACERLRWRPIRSVWRVLDEIIVPMFRSCNWIEIAAIALLAGIGEELLFRGLLQTSIADWSSDFLPHTPSWAIAGDWLAVIAAGIIFGALHSVNLAYAVLAAVMGIYLGWLYLATGNLAVPIIAHGLYDFLALAYVLRGRNIV